MRNRGSAHNQLRLATGLMAATAGSVVLAGCGSANPTPSPTTGNVSTALAAARCMRAHGVPNFPDPGPKGGMTVLFSPGGTNPTIDGITFSGPAVNAAQKICRPLGGPGPAAPPITEQQRRAILDFADCMRRHGFPQWADPTFPPSGGIMGGGDPYARNAPGLTEAQTACNQAALSAGPG